MTEQELALRIDGLISPLLIKARNRSGGSHERAARLMGISPIELREIEERPSKVPCNRLYRVIKRYGPEVQLEAEMIMIELSNFGIEYRIGKEH